MSSPTPARFFFSAGPAANAVDLFADTSSTVNLSVPFDLHIVGFSVRIGRSWLGSSPLEQLYRHSVYARETRSLISFLVRLPGPQIGVSRRRVSYRRMSFALAVDVKRDPGGDWVLTGKKASQGRTGFDLDWSVVAWLFSSRAALPALCICIVCPTAGCHSRLQLM
jgi:hypothetical protein